MANGEWRMANGEWRMANGEWRMNWTIYALIQSHKKKAHIDISTWAF
jgi:hypothetical protein